MRMWRPSRTTCPCYPLRTELTILYPLTWQYAISFRECKTFSTRFPSGSMEFQATATLAQFGTLLISIRGRVGRLDFPTPFLVPLFPLWSWYRQRGGWSDRQVQGRNTLHDLMRESRGRGPPSSAPGRSQRGSLGVRCEKCANDFAYPVDWFLLHSSYKGRRLAAGTRS